MGAKIDNMPLHSRYDVDLDYIISCPRHIRITPYGAARRTYYFQDWADRDCFWLLIDLNNGQRYYLPTTEAGLKLNIFGKSANVLASLKRLSKLNLVFNHRWLVEQISKLHFFANGGAKKKQCWKYKEEVEDREERLDEIRSGRYRPVPLAKYED